MQINFQSLEDAGQEGARDAYASKNASEETCSINSEDDAAKTRAGHLEAGCHQSSWQVQLSFSPQAKFDARFLQHTQIRFHIQSSI